MQYMKRYFLLIFCIAITFVALGQKDKMYEFEGKIFLFNSSFDHNDTTYSIHGGYENYVLYKIVFSKDTKGNIKGFSVCHNPASTELDSAELIGTIRNGKISFDETRPISSNMVMTAEMMYSLFSVKNLEILPLNDTLLKIEGAIYNRTFDFKGRHRKDLDNKWEGTVSLTGKMKFTESDFATCQKMNPSHLNNLTANKDIFSLWKSNIIRIEIFDSEVVDGDQLALIVNGLSFKSVDVAKEKAIIEIPCKSGQLVVLQIEAINEGTIAPNTSAIHIYDSNTQYKFYLRLKKGQKTRLYFLKK